MGRVGGGVEGKGAGEMGADGWITSWVNSLTLSSKNSFSLSLSPFSAKILLKLFKWKLYTYVCMNIYIYICMNVRLYACMCVCIYVCMHACMWGVCIMY